MLIRECFGWFFEIMIAYKNTAKAKFCLHFIYILS